MKKPKFDCRICDGDTTVEFLKEEGLDVVALTIVFMKICNPHAQELQEILTKIECERAAA